MRWTELSGERGSIIIGLTLAVSDEFTVLFVVIVRAFSSVLGAHANDVVLRREPLPAQLPSSRTLTFS